MLHLRKEGGGEREREGDGEGHRERDNLAFESCLYTLVYTFCTKAILHTTYMCTYIC